MDSDYPRISEHRGCCTCCKPSMIAYNDRKDQKKITDISRGFLILATDWKSTVNSTDCDIFNIVCIKKRLHDFLVPLGINIEGIQDIEEKEIGEYHDVNKVGGAQFI